MEHKLEPYDGGDGGDPVTALKDSDDDLFNSEFLDRLSKGQITEGEKTEKPRIIFRKSVLYQEITKLKATIMLWTMNDLYCCLPKSQCPFPLPSDE